MEADSLQQIIAHGQVSSQFFDRCVKNYCIHCQVSLELELEKYFHIDEKSFPWSFGSELLDIQILQEKPMLAAVLVGGSYGIVSLPSRAKYVRCIFPCKESKSCSHVNAFERSQSKKLPTTRESCLNEDIDGESELLQNLIDLNINGDLKSNQKLFCQDPSLKFSWPPSKEIQQRFQKYANQDLKPLNKEACQQFNSLLRSVQTSVSYMTFHNYLQAIKIFIAFYDLK